MGEKECQVPPMDGRRWSTGSSSSAVEMEFFWPLEHPVEPSDEDRPVKCPMTASSAIDGKHHFDNFKVAELPNDRSTETPRKRMELTAMLRSREVISTADARSPAARLDRKRHHTLTNEDIIITPIMRTMLPLPPPPPPPPRRKSTGELTVLQMLQQTHGFEP